MPQLRPRGQLSFISLAWFPIGPIHGSIIRSKSGMLRLHRMGSDKESSRDTTWAAHWLKYFHFLASSSLNPFGIKFGRLMVISFTNSGEGDFLFRSCVFTGTLDSSLDQLGDTSGMLNSGTPSLVFWMFSWWRCSYMFFWSVAHCATGLGDFQGLEYPSMSGFTWSQLDLEAAIFIHRTRVAECWGNTGIPVGCVIDWRST